MAKIFKKKDKNTEVQQPTSKHAQQERSVIRQSSYEDDWMLNIEPILEGDEEGSEEVKKFITENKNTQPDPESNSQINKVVVEGPLSSIISGAKKTNEENVAEVIRGSETHRKMALIEKIRREGGKMPEDIFTDLSKSSFGSEYKNRAYNMSTSYKQMTIQEQLEQRRALSEEKLKERKLNVPEPEPREDIASHIQRRKDLSQRMFEERKKINNKNNPEEEIIDNKEET